MPRTPAETDPSPPDHQQMNRSNDPEVTRALDAAAPEMAMESRGQRLTGSAVGVGSVAFDDVGAYDVGAGETVTETRMTGAPGVAQPHDLGDPVEKSQLTAGGVGPGADGAGPDPSTRRLQEGRALDHHHRDPNEADPSRR